MSSILSVSGGDFFGESMQERSLKRRPLMEMDNQHHLTLRTVKQRLMQHTSPISPLAFSIPTSPDSPIPTSPDSPIPTSPDSPIPTTTMSRLQQIEDQLLNGIEDDSPANHNSEWSESTLQTLIKIPSLRQSLLDAAYALSEGDPDFASALLAHLTTAADPTGDPEQRLAHHMSSALLSRLSAQPIDIGTSHSLQHHHHHHAFPSFDLCFVAANRAILDSSSKARPNLHIVDFDVGDGAQYVSLIESLPRPRPSSITITACAVSELPQSHPPETVGDRLVSLGEQAGVAVRFNVVRCKASELDRKAVGLNDEEETVAVNFAYALQRVADESVTTENPRDVLLRRVRGELRPDVVVLVEENLNTNTAPFAVRFGEVMGHVGSVFGSLEARMGRESAERERVEEWLGRRARDMVAAEGPNRVCRCEVFGKWRARLGMAGYRQRQFGPGVAESVRERIGSGLVGPGLTFKEMDGGLCFGWGDRVLTVVSTWH